MRTLVTTILSEMTGVSTPQAKFLTHLFPTMLASRGRMTFRNLARYGGLHEKTYSRQAATPFDFVAFNRRLIDRSFAPETPRLACFDATFLPKAGKASYGRGRFYNGGHHRAEQGLELSSLVLVDLTCHTALSLSVEQSPVLGPHPTDVAAATLMDHYIAHIQRVAPHLQDTEKTLVVDGGFARKKFFDACTTLGLTLITRLRADANLRYFYEGPKRAHGKGKQKVYDGKVVWTDLTRFERAGTYHGAVVYTHVLQSPHFKRPLRIVVLVHAASPRVPIVLACTEPHRAALTICQAYSARFQIEFTYRDAKQFTGLADSQARDQQRLHFQFNAALTTLNLARAELLLAQDTPHPFVCSLQSVKARYFNEHFLTLFFSKLGLDPECIKKSQQYQWLCQYGAIAA